MEIFGLPQKKYWQVDIITWDFLRYPLSWRKQEAAKGWTNINKSIERRLGLLHVNLFLQFPATSNRITEKVYFRNNIILVLVRHTSCANRWNNDLVPPFFPKKKKIHYQNDVYNLRSIKYEERDALDLLMAGILLKNKDRWKVEVEEPPLWKKVISFWAGDIRFLRSRLLEARLRGLNPRCWASHLPDSAFTAALIRPQPQTPTIMDNQSKKWSRATPKADHHAMIMGPSTVVDPPGMIGEITSRRPNVYSPK